jgi:hypothetical protein
LWIQDSKGTTGYSYGSALSGFKEMIRKEGVLVSVCPSSSTSATFSSRQDISLSPIVLRSATHTNHTHTHTHTHTHISQHLSIIFHTFSCFAPPSLSTKVSASLHSSPLLDRASTLPLTNSARNFHLVRATCFPHLPLPPAPQSIVPSSAMTPVASIKQHGHGLLVCRRRCASDLVPLTRSRVYGSEDTFAGRAHSKCSWWSDMDTHGYREICRLRDLVAVRFVASCGGIWTL